MIIPNYKSDSDALLIKSFKPPFMNEILSSLWSQFQIRDNVHWADTG